MDKNKNKGKAFFGARARALIALYKRADTDATEKAELDQKLAELAQEQEAYKEANGLSGEQNNQYAEQPQGQQMGQGQPQGMIPSMSGQMMGQQAPQGQVQQFPGTGNSTIPNYGVNGFINPNITKDFNLDTNKSAQGLGTYGGFEGFGGENGGFEGQGNSYTGLNNYSLGNSIDPPGKFKNAMSNLDMSGIASAGASVASAGLAMYGNFRARNKANDQKKTLLDMVGDAPQIKAAIQTPNLLDPGREVSSIKKDFADSKSIAARNARNAGGGRGSYMANVMSSNTGLSREQSKAVNQLTTTYAKYNQGEKSRVGQANATARMQTAQFNANSRSRTEQLKLGIESGGANQAQQYRDANFQIPSQAVNDILKIRQQDKMIASLGQDYGWEDNPNRKFWQLPQREIKYKGRQ